MVKPRNQLRYVIDRRGGNNWALVNVLDDDVLIAHFLCELGPYYCKSCSPVNFLCSCANKVNRIWIRRSGPQVDSGYRRQGIARTMYRLVEVYFENRIMPDGKATSDGIAFRKKYEEIYGSWENDFVRKFLIAFT